MLWIWYESIHLVVYLQIGLLHAVQFDVIKEVCASVLVCKSLISLDNTVFHVF